MSFTPWEIMAFVVGLCGFVLTVLNIIDKQNTLKKNAAEPFNNLKARVDAHDVEIGDIKLALKQGNDRFREQEDTNEVLIHSVLALIEFEIQYCLTEHKEPSKDLERAKEDLHAYLSKR
jgi:hypothetical protein